MDPLFDPWSLIRVTRGGEHVAQVQLARPEARNALNGALMAELTEAARLLRLRTDVRAVVLSGAPSFFSAGADLSASGARRAVNAIAHANAAGKAGTWRNWAR